MSAEITQTARLFDQQTQYRNLHLAGTDAAVLRAARMRETWLPYPAAVGALGLVMAAVSITNPLVTKVAHGTLRSSVPRP